MLRTLDGHGDNVNSVTFDANDMLASGFRNKTIKLWNKNSGVLFRTLSGHIRSVSSVAFDDNYMIASGSDDRTIKLWNKNT
jgi:WD40 repeat protein